MTDAPDGGPANRPGRGDALVQVEELRSELTTLRTDVSELAADVVRSDALTGLASKVDRLGQRIETLSEQIADSPEAGPAVTDWDALTRTDAEKAWHKLWQWLTSHYVPRWEPYRTEIPDCWTRHPAMRDTLSAVCDTWKAGHTAGSMAATAAQWDTVWHRHYIGQLAQLAERFGCSPGLCRGSETGLSRPDEDSRRDPERWCRPAEHWLTDGIQTDLDARPEEAPDGDDEMPSEQHE